MRGFQFFRVQAGHTVSTKRGGMEEGAGGVDGERQRRSVDEQCSSGNIEMHPCTPRCTLHNRVYLFQVCRSIVATPEPNGASYFGFDDITEKSRVVRRNQLLA